MSIPPNIVSGRRNFTGLFSCNRFRKIILDVFRFFEFSHGLGQNQKCLYFHGLSALPSGADIISPAQRVRFVPHQLTSDHVKRPSYYPPLREVHSPYSRFHSKR
jgi:hypothetical protein